MINVRTHVNRVRAAVCLVPMQAPNSLLFRLVNFRKKKYSCKIFGQTKLSENNFTSRVWCALIEEIAAHAKEMAGEK